MPDKRTTAWILSICFFVLLALSPATLAIARHNFATLQFVRTITAESMLATERQAMLNRYADHLDPTATVSPEQNLNNSMLQAFFIGEYYRIQGDIVEATRWYRQAAHANPVPIQQHSLAYAQRSRLRADGSLQIHGFSDLIGWRVAENSNVVDPTTKHQNGLTVLSFPNQIDQRDLLTYQLFPGAIPIGYHSVLSLRVLGSPGSFLTLEATIDGKLNRYINYHSCTGQWETLRVPLEGNQLEAVFLGLSEPNNEPSVPYHKYQLDWLRLEIAGL